MIKLKINGQEQSWDGDPDLPLLWFLRDEVGLTGTKFGCGQALCGACTVMVDKDAVRSCITSVSDVVDLAGTCRCDGEAPSAGSTG
jgi:isoquinoline 1-oxidoreductase alpha subunit